MMVFWAERRPALEMQTSGGEGASRNRSVFTKRSRRAPWPGPASYSYGWERLTHTRRLETRKTELRRYGAERSPSPLSLGRSMLPIAQRAADFGRAAPSRAPRVIRREGNRVL